MPPPRPERCPSLPRRPRSWPRARPLRRIAALLTVAAVASGACGSAAESESPVPGGAGRVEAGTAVEGAGQAGGDGPIVANATVVRVVDGDTIHVERGGTEQTVRLIGMDTPETKKPNTAVECYGHEASAHMEGLLPTGTRVRLERDAEERDRYDRLLAYAYREDGTFVNLAMVADGYAGQLTIPPNVAHADELTQAAAAAREQGRGLWSACGGNHVAAR